MKVSELIRRLTLLEVQCGDVEVVIPDGRDGFEDEYNEVDTVDIVLTEDKILIS